MEHKLAIVIPYYKIDFFEETIKSVAQQTDQRFTLYIGNDASPDNPLPIIEKYFPNGDYQYFNYQENLGGINLALQWERILENVTEEWFMILGDDDRIAFNFVEEFYKHQDSTRGINLIKARNVIVKEEDVLKYDFTKNISGKRYNIVDFFFQKIHGTMNSSLSEHIFRKSAFSEFRKYPLAWHDDDYAILQITKCKEFFFLKDTKVIIREYSGSISGKKDNLDKKKTASDLFYNEVLTLFQKNKVAKKQKHIYLKEYIKRYPMSNKVVIYHQLYGKLEGTYYLSIFYLGNYYRKFQSK